MGACHRPILPSRQSDVETSPQRAQVRRTSETQASAGVAAREEEDSPEEDLMADPEGFRSALGGAQSPPTPTNLASTIATTEKFRVVSTLSYDEIKRLQHFVTSGEAVGGRYNYSRLLDVTAQRLINVMCSNLEDKEWWQWDSGKLFSLLFKYYPPPSQSSAAGADARNFAMSMVLDLRNTTAALTQRGEMFTLINEKTKAENLTPAVVSEQVQAAMKRQVIVGTGPSKRYREKILEEAAKATTWIQAEEAIFRATSAYSELLSTLQNDYGMELAPPTKPAGDRGAGSQKSGSTRNPHEARQAKSSDGVICHACGKHGHKAGKETCLFVFGKHPDINLDWKTSWADSAKGKACKEHGLDSLPARKTLAGAAFDFNDVAQKFRAKEKKGNSPSLHICCNTHIGNTALTGHTLGCGVHGAIPSQFKIFDTLIDTGALQANYMALDVAAWLTSHGIPLRTDVNTCRVCGLYGCTNTKEYAIFSISLLDKNSKNIFNLIIKAWLIKDSPYDLIIGRPTIEEHKLLDRISLAGNALALAWEEQKPSATVLTILNNHEKYPSETIEKNHEEEEKNPREKNRKKI